MYQIITILIRKSCSWTTCSDYHVNHLCLAPLQNEREGGREHFNTIDVTNLTEQPHGNTSKFHNADVFVHPTSIFWSLNISYGCTQDFVFG